MSKILRDISDKREKGEYSSFAPARNKEDAQQMICRVEKFVKKISLYLKIRNEDSGVG